MRAKQSGNPRSLRESARAAGIDALPAPAASTWLRQLLLQLTSVALADARRMEQFPSSGLHALRVRMKKLKALLRLAGDVVPGRTMDSLATGIRSVKDPLAPARDAEVLQKTAREFDVRIAALETMAGTEVPDLHPVLRRLQQRLTRLDLSALQWTDISRAHEKVRRRTRKAMKRSKRSGESPDFHAWRRRVKELYFQRLVVPGDPQAPKRLHRLRKLARLLGKVQDLTMLEEYLDATAGEPGLRVRVAAQRTDLQGKALRKGRKATR